MTTELERLVDAFAAAKYASQESFASRAALLAYVREIERERDSYKRALCEALDGTAGWEHLGRAALGSKP